MEEFKLLQEQCVDLINSNKLCGNDCPLDHFCIKSSCRECDCKSCLYHIQHANLPTFHYRCKRITYFYVLRFFNRFASEFYYLVKLVCESRYFQIQENLNIVSLGCGPGSEVYGFLKFFNLQYPDVTIHYEGHDLNCVWETVQQITTDKLSNTPHEIQFYNTDLFFDYHGFQTGVIDFFVLNYVLSDMAKFTTSEQKMYCITNIANFVLENNVKHILFNDICYYGDLSLLDSGVMLMKKLISKLIDLGQSKGKTVKYCFIKFPFDPKTGNEKWFSFKTSNLVFPLISSNHYMDNVGYCHSKQIYVNIV